MQAVGGWQLDTCLINLKRGKKKSQQFTVQESLTGIKKCNPTNPPLKNIFIPQLVRSIDIRALISLLLSTWHSFFWTDFFSFLFFFYLYIFYFLKQGHISSCAEEAEVCCIINVQGAEAESSEQMLGAQHAGDKRLECKKLPSHVCSSAQSRQGFNLTSWLDAGNSQISVKAKQIWPPTAWPHSGKRVAVVEMSPAPAAWHHTRTTGGLEKAHLPEVANSFKREEWEGLKK